MHAQLTARLRLPAIFSLFLALCPIWTAALAQEWTRFRGPNGTGIAAPIDLPIQWTEKDYAWRVETPGVGHSSPVVWGDCVFVTSAIEADGKQIIRCLAAADGKTLWNREYPGEVYRKNGKNCYASATPVVDEKHLYVKWTVPEHFFVVALDRKTGVEQWRHDLGNFDGEHGSGSSPILWRSLVIMVNDQKSPGSIVALDCASGKVRWSVPRKPAHAAYNTPILYQPKDGPEQLISTSTGHGFSSHDPATGKLNWELPLFTSRVVGSPIVADGVILASAGSGGGANQMYGVRPGDPAKKAQPEKVYELKRGTLPYVPTSVTYDRLAFLFGDGGIITCIQGATGEKVWQERLEANFFSSPIRVGQRIYCIARDGQMVVLAAADQYKLLARFELGEASNATPAVSGGTMYLRTVSHVMALKPHRPQTAGN